MKKIVKRLRDEVKKIEVMEKKAKERLRHVPKGHLRIMKKRGKAQYYYRNADSTDVRECSYNGRYLRRDEIILAKQIAQRDYDMQFLNIVEKRRKAINNFVEIYEQTDLGEVYQKINPYRYEYPLMLEGNIRKCPDFTILKMPERKEVYLEHLGINLFFTHETSKHPLNTRVLDEMIQKWFL